MSRSSVKFGPKMSALVVIILAVTALSGIFTAGAFNIVSPGLGRAVGEPSAAREVSQASPASIAEAPTARANAVVPATTTSIPGTTLAPELEPVAAPLIVGPEVEEEAPVVATELDELIVTEDQAQIGSVSREPGQAEANQPTTSTTTTTPTTTTVTVPAPVESAPDAELSRPLRAVLRDLAQSTARPFASAPAAGQGCQGECRVVGFQDLSNQSGVVLENVVISNPSGVCVDLTGASDVTLRNVSVVGCGTEQAVSGGYSAGLIHIENARNITIENSVIRDMSNEAFGGSRNNAIEVQDSSNVTIRSNFIGDVRSDIGDKSDDRGNRAIFVEGESSGIRIDSNRFYNAGRNAVQVSRVRDAVGISVTNNVVDGRGRWDSDYEDMINLFSSSGTAGDPIVVSGNTLRNGGPSTSGTGIILGDGNTSSGATQFVLVEDNVLIDPGHVGISLAGGNNITIRDNIIVGIGEVPHTTTVGFTINDYGYSAECRDHVVADNQVWMDNQHLPSGTNHLWNPGTCTNNVALNNNIFGQ